MQDVWHQMNMKYKYRTENYIKYANLIILVQAIARYTWFGLGKPYKNLYRNRSEVQVNLKVTGQNEHLNIPLKYFNWFTVKLEFVLFGIFLFHLSM